MKNGHILALGAAIAITTGGFVATATPAFAAAQVVVRAPADVPVRLVRYADIDLTAVQGQKQLNRRVGVAVREVCEGSASYATFQSEGFCHTAAWNRARPQIARAIDNARLMAANGLKPSGEAIVIAL